MRSRYPKTKHRFLYGKRIRDERTATRRGARMEAFGGEKIRESVEHTIISFADPGALAQARAGEEPDREARTGAAGARRWQHEEGRDHAGGLHPRSEGLPERRHPEPRNSRPADRDRGGDHRADLRLIPRVRSGEKDKDVVPLLHKMLVLAVLYHKKISGSCLILDQCYLIFNRLKNHAAAVAGNSMA